MKVNLNQFAKIIIENAPKILQVIGVAGAVVSTVAACKATLKVDTIIKEHNETIEKIEENKKCNSEIYSENDAKVDKVKCYSITAVQIVKEYTPAIIIGSISIACMLKSNSILQKRCTSFAAAYGLVDKAFKEYRARVVKRFGADIDKQLLTGSGLLEITKEITDEKGETKTVKEKIEVSDGKESGYTKYITRSNPNWQDNQDYMEMFLRAQMSTANFILRDKKFITWNEVLRLLDLKEEKAGLVVGWKYEKNNPEGDNKVIFDVTKINIMNEDGSFEPAYAIDFNVDGNIYSRL